MDENQVVAAVCRYLETGGWAVTERRHTSQQGVDVVAAHAGTGRACYVEAKGGTSARAGTARYGMPFTGAQIAVHVARAVFAALQLRTRHPDPAVADVLIAVPDERRHRTHLDSVAPALRSASIGTLFVAPDGSIRPT